jgi:hypothetical protein
MSKAPPIAPPAAAPAAPVAPAAPAPVAAPMSPLAEAVANAPAPAAPAPVNPAAPSVPHDWMQVLPPELHGDATLGRYKTIEALARGHLETKQLAGAPKLPAADQALDSFDAFHVMRPADPAGYQIDVPEGYGTEYADGLRNVAHEIGLHPSQVAKLVAFNNSAVAEMMGAEAKAATAEIEAFKNRFVAGGGDFDASLGRVAALLEQNGLPTGDDQAMALNALQKQFGGAAAVQMLFSLADKFGEPAPPPIDLGNGQIFTVAGASSASIAAQRTQLLGNAEFAKQARIDGTPQHAQYQALIKAEAVAKARGL